MKTRFAVLPFVVFVCGCELFYALKLRYASPLWLDGLTMLSYSALVVGFYGFPLWIVRKVLKMRNGALDKALGIAEINCLALAWFCIIVVGIAASIVAGPQFRD